MKLHSLIDVSLLQLKRAIALKQRITSLESRLAGLLGFTGATGPSRRGRPALGATRAGVVTRGKRRRKKMSAKGRASLSASARARWAKAKAAGKNSL